MSSSSSDVGATDLSCYTSGDSPADADLYGCMVNDAAAAFGGQEILGLFVGAGIMLALYIASDFEPAAPTVGTILIGSMLIPALPAQYSSIGVTMMVLGAVIGIFVAAQRYVLEVGT
jgi:hypothetical protein